MMHGSRASLDIKPETSIHSFDLSLRVGTARERKTESTLEPKGGVPAVSDC